MSGLTLTVILSILAIGGLVFLFIALADPFEAVEIFEALRWRIGSRHISI